MDGLPPTPPQPHAAPDGAEKVAVGRTPRLWLSLAGSQGPGATPWPLWAAGVDLKPLASAEGMAGSPHADSPLPGVGLAGLPAGRALRLSLCRAGSLAPDQPLGGSSDPATSPQVASSAPGFCLGGTSWLSHSWIPSDTCLLSSPGLSWVHVTCSQGHPDFWAWQGLYEEGGRRSATPGGFTRENGMIRAPQGYARPAFKWLQSLPHRVVE